MTVRRIVFGLVLPGAAAQGDAKRPEVAERLDRLAALIGGYADLTIERHEASSYETLAAGVREGAVDLAWLPPIVYVRASDAATPIGSIVRDGQSAYESALVVRADSKIRTLEGLLGSRAGWIDPWSAAGFVLPRVELALRGVDPRTLFRAEMFHGSHRAAIQALMAGACDVVGTYARADAKGDAVAGSWSEVEGADVRVLATFGAIPADVVAVRRELPDDDRIRLTKALMKAGESPEARAILRATFGGEELREGPDPGYAALKTSLEKATAQGLFG